MQVCPITSYYYIDDIAEHNLYKTKLLSLISNLENKSIKTNKDSISKTDWNLDHSNQEYYQLLQKLLDPSLKNLCKYFSATTYEVHNIWFQQYKENDVHNWHTHSHCNFASVYFLELPDKKFATEFLDLETNKIINVNVSEGQLLTFPAHFIHRSPPINNSIKTIISFNTSFIDTELSYE